MKFGKFLDLINKVIEIICSILLAIMVIVTFAQAANRYIFKGSFFWAEEAAIWSMIWITLLGSSIAMHHHSHTRIDFVLNSLPKKIRKWVEVFDYLLIAVFLGYLGWYSIPVIRKTGRLISTGLKFPRSVVFYSILIGCILMIIDCIVTAVKYAIADPEEVYQK